jgi:hypothetical protein
MPGTRSVERRLSTVTIHRALGTVFRFNMAAFRPGRAFVSELMLPHALVQGRASAAVVSPSVKRNNSADGTSRNIAIVQPCSRRACFQSADLS